MTDQLHHYLTPPVELSPVIGVGPHLLASQAGPVRQALEASLPGQRQPPEQTPAPQVESGSRPRWERRYAFWLPFADTAFLLAAVFLAKVLRSAAPGLTPPQGASALLVLALVVGWVASLGLSGAYESRLLGQGPEEYKRVLTSTWHFAAALAIGSYAIQVPFGRGFFLIVMPLGAFLLMAGRHAVRRFIGSLRDQGKALHRVLVVGPAYAAGEAIRHIGGAETGFHVVGVCAGGLVADGMYDDVPVLDGFGDIPRAIARTGADTVAVVGTSDLPAGFIQQLAWELEGTGVDLMLSPAITDVAGPRIHVRPIANLSMLYVEEPQFRGAARLAKALFDRVLAGGLLLILGPLMLAVAGLVKLTSPGPALFFQPRAGLHGEYFKIWKFRTMRVEAELVGEGYDLARELGTLGVKESDDPRITRLGRFLRQTSLDELPQLVNVLRGQMSLVGPRPICQHEVDSFVDRDLRRHLVKPGMTGLWQVSGRSEVSWQERISLDLHYVENWSPWLDLTIVVRTVAAVMRRSGAY